MALTVNRKIIQRTDNRPNVPFAGGKSRWITIHMTGNRSGTANAAAHANWIFNSAPYSWHATVDDLEAWQHLEWSEQGWHAGDGDGPGNTSSIGIEICMNEGINQERAYLNAAELVRLLIADGHGRDGVVQHNRWSGKNCPELIRAEPGKWEWFLERVRVPAPPLDPEHEALRQLNDAVVQRFAIIGLAADTTERGFDRLQRAHKLLKDAGLI